MDVAGLISDFLTGTYQVTRRASAPPQRGRDQDGSASTFSIDAAVAPASGRDLLRLPEGRRAIETRRLFTATELLTGGQGAAAEADLVLIDGEAWEVQLVNPWRDPMSGQVGYDCIVQAAR